MIHLGQILTYPCISAKTVAPVLSIIASTSSTTSKYASLLLYLTPVRRQGIVDNCPDGRMPLTLKFSLFRIWFFVF